MSSTQSWTSWILDSYASSVHPTTTSPDTESSDPIEDVRTKKSPPRLHSRSQSASSSHFGPYVKTGRGGSGNFTWQSEQPKPDVEAQRQSSRSERQPAATQIEPLESTDAWSNLKKRRQSAQFLRMGIGGAGNVSLVQSNEAQSPRSPNFTRSTSSPLGSTFPRIHHGRGGSGNYAAAMEAERHIESEKEYEERIAAEQTREKIEQDVESLLKAPQGALLSERRRKDGVM